MCDLDLLERIRSKEPDAFLELTERYGWAVYSVIREKYTDHVVADKIYNETMNTFYHCLADSDSEDPLETLLCAFAAQKLETEAACLRNVPDMASSHMLPEIQLEVRGSRQERKKGKDFWYLLGILVLLVAFVASLWFIVGILMDLNYIPYYDLGYSWFNANVMPFFNGVYRR